MGRPLRILHLADSHIGAGWPLRPRVDRPRRGDDFVDSLSRVLNLALQQETDLVIHAGDLFNMPEPCSRALAAASDALLRIAAAGVPVVLVPGNHERQAISSTLLLAHPNIHVMSEPRTITLRLNGTQVSVSAFACSRRNAAAKFPPALDATGWAASRADLRILALHETFESATCGPASFRFRSGDDVVERDAVPAEFDYVACGHIHRHQVLRRPDDRGPAIVYAGSTDRISFAEVSEPKGCVLVEATNGRLAHRFVEHDVRPMSIHPVLVTDLNKQQIAEQVRAIIESIPPRAVAQIRLAGCVSKDSLRDLRFTETARSLRPDVLVTVSAQAVEFTDQPPAIGSAAPPKAVAALDPALPPVTHQASLDNIADLPATCGVYALYDAADRLLYVGKARNVRGRVRTHVRGRSGAHFFHGWGRQISRITVRAADSELEALLLEAAMIASLQPAYNRQMRRWTGYCYLRENGSPHRQLEVSADRPTGDRCFGPFRSRFSAEAVRDAVAVHFGLAACTDPQPVADRQLLLSSPAGARLCSRYYKGTCGGPCAARVTDEEYDRRISRRDALLNGLDDNDVRELESQLEAPPGEGWTEEMVAQLTTRTEMLRSIFDHCAAVRAAEALQDGMLLMPGPPGRRKVAMLARTGASFDILADDPADAERILIRHRAITARDAADQGNRLPKETLDSLCIIAREMSKPPAAGRHISHEEIERMSAPTLLATAFCRPTPHARPRQVDLHPLSAGACGRQTSE